MNFIPKAGEIIVYDADDTHSTVRIKVGNDSTKINELPFISSNDNRIFIAEYGVTTFDEIIEAANTDKKTVLCRINDVGTIFTLAYCHADGARFVGHTSLGEQEACCEPNNEWTIHNISIQADWSQNDETAPDYVKNRTHYGEIIVHDSITEPKIISGNMPTGYGTLRNKFCTKQEVLNQTVKMPEGKYIRITLGGVTKIITTPPAVDTTGRLPKYREDIILDNGVTINVSLTATEPLSGMSDSKNRYYRVMPITTPELEPYIGTPFTVELVSGELKQLDEKYIPNTIARVADIENIPIITPEMIMAMLDEVQLAQPVADADNSVLTTDDDKILIL